MMDEMRTKSGFFGRWRMESAGKGRDILGRVGALFGICKNFIFLKVGVGGRRRPT